MSRIAILGAGAFGTALAMAAARAGQNVLLIGRCEEQIAQMQRNGENPRLPGIRLRPGIEPSADAARAADADAILLAVPAQHTEKVLALQSSVLAQKPLLFCAKGITGTALALQTDLAPDPSRAAVLSGPGFADEIAQGLPTALTLAGPDDLTKQLQDLMSSPALRLYRTEDAIGAQLGGALKNVVAIAAGITMGAGLGESARSAVMTRGFAEMRRLAAARGARAETLMGLSGFGDLALTAGSQKSRNYRHGLALGEGRAPGSATVEGVATASAAVRLAAAAGVEMPLAEAVLCVLEGTVSVGDAIGRLLARPVGRE